MVQSDTSTLKPDTSIIHWRTQTKKDLAFMKELFEAGKVTPVIGFFDTALSSSPEREVEQAG